MGRTQGPRDRYVGLPLDLTGGCSTVGPMTRESAKVAMTWVRSHADRLSGAARLDDSTDIPADVGGPAVCGGHAGVERGVRVGEPLRPRGALLEGLRGVLFAGNRPLRISGDRLVDPVDHSGGFSQRSRNSTSR